MPFLSGWGKRKAIEYGTIFPDSNLTDFPLLITIAADSNIASELSGGGGIAVTAADGDTEIPFGLYPSSDPSSGDITLRLLTDLLTAASTGDVIGYIYYDALQTTTEDKAGTVANGYAVFMPLEEDPSTSAPQMFDWVTETNKGTSSGSMTSGDLVAAVVANGIDFDGVNDEIDVAVAPVQGAFSWELWTKPADSGGGFLLSALDGGNNGQRIFTINSGTMTARGQLVDDGGNVTNLTTSNSTTAGVFSYVVWTAAPSGTAALYLNGVLEDTDTVVSTLNTQADTKHTIANRSDAGSGEFPGIIDELRISSVVRSADWIEYAYNNDLTPEDTTQLGDEETDDGDTITLTADNGSYTVSGQTASLRRALRLDSANGSYVLNGQNANLLNHQLLNANNGSYVLSGQTANLSKTRAVIADNGTYSLNGQTASLLNHQRLTADAGSYNLNGQDATLTINTTAADGGSYVVNGQNANLLRNRLVGANNGSYTLNGQTVAFQKFKAPLVANAGSYTVSGQNTNLLNHHIITATFGQYTLTGRRATLLAPGDSAATSTLLTQYA